MISYLDFNVLLEHCIEVDPDSNVYLLLDHGGLPGLVKQLSRSATEWVSLFEDTNEENALTVAPILVLAVADKSVRLAQMLLKWLSEHGTYSSTISVLSSSLDLRTLKSHMVERLDVKLSENMEAMLRYFDPRVFEGLVNVLTLEQKWSFFFPVSSWWYVDRSGKIQCAGAGKNEAEMVSQQLELTSAQEQALICKCEVDQILASLRQNACDLMQRIMLPQQYKFVDENVQEARSFGVDSIDALKLYCVIALAMGREFMRGSTWSSAMKEVKNKSIDLQGIVASMNFDNHLEIIL